MHNLVYAILHVRIFLEFHHVFSSLVTSPLSIFTFSALAQTCIVAGASLTRISAL